MSHQRKLLLAAATVVLLSACATPEERLAKLQLKQQKLELRTQQMNERAAARRAMGPVTPDAVTDQPTALANVVKAIANCDASLPITLKQFATELEPQVPVVIKTNGASIGVPDRTTPGRSSVAVASPSQVNGVPVSGFFDEATVIAGNTEKVSWGFYSPVGAAQLSSTLGARIPNYKQVRLDVGGAMLRMDIYDGMDWRRTTRYDYFRRQADVAGERVFAIEASRDPAFPGTRVSCSVRGTQLKTVLPALRPDLG